MAIPVEIYKERNAYIAYPRHIVNAFKAEDFPAFKLIPFCLESSAIALSLAVSDIPVSAAAVVLVSAAASTVAAS